jgi:hypothetical protein
VYIGLCRVLFRRAFTFSHERADTVMGLSEREAITDPRLLVKSLVVLTAVIGAFVLHTVLHLEPAVVALLGAGILLAVSRLPVSEALAEVEWPTLAFFMGLFVMVGGLVHTGVIETLSEAAAEATEEAAPRMRTCCGGRSRWVRTWAATPRPSARPRTWSSSVSPSGTVTGSRSGSSLSTAWWSPWSRWRCACRTCICASSRSRDFGAAQ